MLFVRETIKCISWTLEANNRWHTHTNTHTPMDVCVGSTLLYWLLLQKLLCFVCNWVSLSVESWFSSSFSQKQNAASWPLSQPFRLWPPFFVVVLCLHVLCHAAKCNLHNQCGVLTVQSQSVILWCLFLKPTQRLIFQVEGWMDGAGLRQVTCWFRC